MAWDALVCTSTVALDVVTSVFDDAADFYSWRHGRRAGPQPAGMTPVIPLGVHCGDFTFTDADRQTARAALGLEPGTVAILSAGRLSISAKANPYILAAHAARATSPRRPDRAWPWCDGGTDLQRPRRRRWPRVLGPDSLPRRARDLRRAARTPAPYRQAWAAGDIFISLSDSIQETFGLTPIEAMAAGLPVVVSDWNGYKDTVRDGVDGFRIPTWTPPPGVGERIAVEYEGGGDLRASISIAATPPWRSTPPQLGRARLREAGDGRGLLRRRLGTKPGGPRAPDLRPGQGGPTAAIEELLGRTG